MTSLDIELGEKNIFFAISNFLYKFLLIKALRIYKEIDNVPMVWSLESIVDIEDWKLICGYINMFLNNYDKAQEWFLKSSNPNVALEMRRDLLQWEIALQLAKKMAPEQIAMISREYAQQLEFM